MQCSALQTSSSILYDPLLIYSQSFLEVKKRTMFCETRFPWFGWTNEFLSRNSCRKLQTFRAWFARIQKFLESASLGENDNNFSFSFNQARVGTGPISKGLLDYWNFRHFRTRNSANWYFVTLNPTVLATPKWRVSAYQKRLRETERS